MGKIWYGRNFFCEAKEHQRNNYAGLDDIEKAIQIYILITQSFNCTRKTFSPKAFKDTETYRRNINHNLPFVHERLKNVLVLNGDGIELINKIKDDEKTFAFLDPPYRKELRGKNADNAYKCELRDDGQKKLLETIKNAKCKIMLCGYRSKGGTDLYDKYLLSRGWKCYKLADVVKACQRSYGKKDMAEEFIWVNYELPSEAKYVISLREYSSL